MFVLYNVQMESFEIDAVTIEKSMTEYHFFKQSGLPFILT